MNSQKDVVATSGDFGANVLIRGHRCYRCGHAWVPEKLDFSKIPIVCPKCKSPYWHKPKQKRDKGAKK